MIKKSLVNFNLKQIADSGQCFRIMRTQKDIFRIIAGKRCLYIEADKKMSDTYIFHCSAEVFEDFWSSYFDLETPYQEIGHKIDVQDVYMQKAYAFGSGIRILRQDLWETIITFIISQQNNIKRIRKTIELLCLHYGQQLEDSLGSYYHTFPEPSALASVPVSELRFHGLGYRDNYIKSTAGIIHNNPQLLRNIKSMDYKDAKAELIKLNGVGIKVAECICLFSLHHCDAFPVDTHIKKILDLHYPQGFPYSRYQGYAGILQQYAFYYDLYGSK